MNTFITVAQFILALSILVTLHEFGHFWAARAFGIRVEKFYLFFDAWGFKFFKFKRGDTEYGIGWLPLGGYVKIAGMIDESLDTNQLKSPAQPWEFRSKPAWQRLIVMVGGVFVNLILGITIMIVLTFTQGERYIPNSAINAMGGIYASPVARSVGFQVGDKISALNKKPVDNLFLDFFNPSFLMQDNKEVSIARLTIPPPHLRGNEVGLTENSSKNAITTNPTSIIASYHDTILRMPKNFEALLSKKSDLPFFAPRLRFKIGKVVGGSNADKAGLEQGDEIVTIDNDSNLSFYEFKELLLNKSGQTVKLGTKSSDGKQSKTMASIYDDGTLGFQPEFYGIEKLEKKINYSLGESVNLGVSRSFGLISANAKALGKVATGKMDASKSLAGPVGIAQMFGSKWDWVNFWTLTAMLSLVLAFFNMLPIPALDGGHSMFLLYEIISGRPVSEKVLYVGQVIGIVLLLSLVAFTFWVDIARALGI